ncbi:MAG: glycosyltransferase family 9 protein [Anaerolineae bacterium]
MAWFSPVRGTAPRRKFDLAVSLVRSPLMSAAVWLSGIPRRAGLDSNGRGFGYNVRAPIDPAAPRHEGDIYLDVSRALGIDVSGCWATLPVRDTDRAAVRARVPYARYLVINPAGGRNPGMVMDVKRYPPDQMAALADRLSEATHLPLVLIGAASDHPILEAVTARLNAPHTVFAGNLSFAEIGALAADAVAYIGNDTGLTHLAAASGARTIMILGPTDPVRYAPFVPADRALALWKPARVSERGVAAALPTDWDWTRDGISVDEAFARIRAFLPTP